MEDRDKREPSEREAPAPDEDERITPTRRDHPVRLEYAVPYRGEQERR